MTQGINNSNKYSQYANIQLPKHAHNPVTDLYNIKLDGTFKYLFGQEKHKRLTIGFLNDFYENKLPSKIEDITFTNKDISDGKIDYKRGYVDILCTSVTGEQFIIEMQNYTEMHYDLRALYYLSHKYIDQFKTPSSKRKTTRNRTIDYNKALPVHILTIFNNIVYTEDDQCIGFGRFYDPDISRCFTNHMTFATIELPKFTKTLDDCKSSIDYWIYLVKNAEKLTQSEINKIMHNDTNNFMEEAIMTIQRSNLSVDERLSIDMSILTQASMDASFEAEKREYGVQKMKEGIGIGREQIFASLINMGILTEEQISQIFRDNNPKRQAAKEKQHATEQ